MAVTFLGLLWIQIIYMKNMVEMRYEQFTQGVRQSLLNVAVHLEQDEALYFLEKDVNQIKTSSLYAQYYGDPVTQLGGVKYSFTTSSGLEANLTIKGDASEINKIRRGDKAVGRHYQNMQNVYRDHYLYQKGMLDDVILNIISTASERPIEERADSSLVRRYLREELDTLGFNVPFEFALVNHLGTVQYKSGGFMPTTTDSDNMFVQTLFANNTSGRPNFLKVYFPTKADFIFSSISFMVPSFAFTLIMLIVFVFTIIVAFRQKKLTEMKNDFINNMTHEFKTPISTISLAAQMLNDPSVRKSQPMLQHISGVINDETKRLRFQVEKVLQMSMFDKKKATLRFQEVDANSVIQQVINTFRLKVEKYGGKLSANLDAPDAIINVDEMHFTNVIFNLLDNAVKYRKEDVPLELSIATRDLGNDRLQITISDNGIGIRKEDLRKIFEKFYRVSTGNRHDVKGFGLGLAYVNKMTELMGGNIKVESDLGKGTTFHITMPLLNN